MDLKEAILSTIKSIPGIKGVDLVLNVMGQINPTRFNDQEYFMALDELLKREEIVEVEYMLPDMEYRIKSIYFPKGTRVVSRVSNWGFNPVVSVQKR